MWMPGIVRTRPLSTTVLFVSFGVVLPNGHADRPQPMAVSFVDQQESNTDYNNRYRPERASFALRNGRAKYSYNIQTLSIIPGGTLTLAVADRRRGQRFTLRLPDGAETVSEDGSWYWTAPVRTGLQRLTVLRTDSPDSIVVNVFVTVPSVRLEGEMLNGYRIGRYPRPPRPIYRRPNGFIEVTPENLDVLVSPHFRLRQFVCKQPSRYPKYLVLDPLLLNKLEYLLERVNAAGYHAKTFFVMSGYRTPFYNRSIGNVALSRHVWGAAADIYIDEDGDGYMDDINGDGARNIEDIRILYRIADREAAKADYAVYLGGLGTYRANSRHGPYLHVDVRGRRARWWR